MTVDRTDPGPRIDAHHHTGHGVTRIGYPIGIRTCELTRRTELTPGMLRLTLSGPELAGLHTYQCDDHIALVFPDEDGTLRRPVPTPDHSLDWPQPLPRHRKYTIRRYDAATNELDLDVVVHPGGLASEWAATAAIGSTITVAGPPGSKAFAHNYDHYIFAVDATALPSVERWLRETTATGSADIVIEVGSEPETGYPLPERADTTVQWLVRGDHESRLAATVAALPTREGNSFLFAAGEADDLKALRSWTKGRMDALITGYWKRGVGDFHGD